MPYLSVESKCGIECRARKKINICVRMGQIKIRPCHNSASHTMPNGDQRDGLFCPTLTCVIMILANRVKSGIFGQKAKCGQHSCLFYSSIIGIKIN